MEDKTQPTGHYLPQPEKEELFKGIYESTFDDLYRTLLRVFKKESLVRDALQEAYLKLWVKLGEGHRQDNYMPFLYFYARNYLIKQISRDLKRELLQNELFRGKDQVDVEQEIELKEYHLRLNLAIDKLPAKRKEVYRLFNEEGMSYRSIGEKLSVSCKTVDNHLSQATNSIKKELKSVYWITRILLVFFVNSF
jgi:RNA polymerase sigma-70 factor (ECF subfamily)